MEKLSKNYKIDFEVFKFSIKNFVKKARNFFKKM